jgi:coenzyme PQQ synthesis protein D (PqqD)
MNAECRVTVRDGVMFNRVGDEVVLLDLDSGTYFGLDSVGGRMWDLLSGSATIGEAIETMLDEYEIDREVLERDVLRLVSELEEKGLISAA